jgi:hypothetical protein
MFKLLKWFFKTLLVLTGIISSTRCGSGYKEKDGKVYFNGKEITDKSFVVLNEVFAKDSSFAYYKEATIEYADLATFIALDEHYAKDKNSVYYCNEFRESQNYYLTKKKTINTIGNVDPSTFTALENGYAKDKKLAFFEGTSFPISDVASFKSINPYFAKDDHHAYFNLKPIKGSDGKSFELINSNYAWDSLHVYYYGYPGQMEPEIYTIPCNRSTFQVLDYPYSKDKDFVFYENKKMNGLNAPSFTILKYSFSKDSSSVFFETKKIEGADVSTFKVFEENDSLSQDFYYTRDKNNIFWMQQKVNVMATEQFKVLGHGYGSDGQQVYYKTSIVKNADPKSFKVYPHGIGNADAEDARNKYSEGKIALDE